MKKIVLDSKSKLNDVFRLNPEYNVEYIMAQWIRQRECELKVICPDGVKHLTERLEHLMELQDTLQEAQWVFDLRDEHKSPITCLYLRQEMKTLRRKRQRIRSQADDQLILRIPSTLLLIEEEIDSVVEELGSDEFRDIPGGSSESRRFISNVLCLNLHFWSPGAIGLALIRLQLSKGKLYEAKVGLLEEQKQANQQSGMYTFQTFSTNTVCLQYDSDATDSIRLYCIQGPVIYRDISVCWDREKRI